MTGRDSVTEWLKNHTYVEARILSYESGIAPATLRQALCRMYGKGLLERVAYGIYKKAEWYDKLIDRYLDL